MHPQLFGFGPVTPDGQGIGYIIKDEGISICASSKHLQTRRFLDNVESYLHEIQRMLIQTWRQANDRSDSFVDHSGTVRDARTGKAIEVVLRDDGKDDGEDKLGMTPILQKPSSLTFLCRLSRWFRFLRCRCGYDSGSANEETRCW